MRAASSKVGCVRKETFDKRGGSEEPNDAVRSAKTLREVEQHDLRFITNEFAGRSCSSRFGALVQQTCATDGVPRNVLQRRCEERRSKQTLLQ